MKTRRTELGYLEVWPKPTEQELEKYYNDKYFAHGEGQYPNSYSPEAAALKDIPCLEALQFMPKRASGTLLDLGCGEGFFLNYYDRLGWDVTGADFTADGIQHFFPHLKEKVRVGNLFHTIEALVKQGKRYDLVVCNNVVEHVIDPIGLLKHVKALLAPGGTARIVVPNDDSFLQHEAAARGFAEPDFFVAMPDHLSYFNSTSFPATLEANGLKVKALLAEFPVDLFLFNPDTNYKKSPERGKNCHRAKIMIENLLVKQSIQNLIAFREGCAKAGIGRNLIAYCEAAK